MQRLYSLLLKMCVFIISGICDMKLFKYELKKNVLRLSVFILLLALIGVNLFKQHETARFLGDSRIAIGVEDKSSLGRKMYEELLLHLCL